MVVAGSASLAWALVMSPSALSATSGTSPVCNNIHGGDGSTCNAGDAPHGTVSWQVLGNGDLRFDVTGTGYEWSDLFVCTPYPGPTQGADCTGADDRDPGSHASFSLPPSPHARGSRAKARR